MTYASVFGANGSRPGPTGAYQAITLVTSTSLDWPLIRNAAGAFVAAQIDVTPSASGLVLRMPSALSGSRGAAAVIANAGGISFALADAGGGSITSIAAGQASIVTLTANTTVSGVWRATPFGTLTSGAQAGQLADNTTLQANPTALQAIELVNSYSGGAVLTVVNRGTLNILVSGSAASTWTLDATSALLANGISWWCDVMNESASALTIVPTIVSGNELINGSSSLIVNPGTSTRIVLSSAATGSFWATDTGLQQNAVILGFPYYTFGSISPDVAGRVLTSLGTITAAQWRLPAVTVRPPTANLMYNSGCRVGGRADARITTNVTGSYLVGQVDLINHKIFGGGVGLIIAGTLTRQSGNSFGSTGYSSQVTGLTTAAPCTVYWAYRIESRDSVSALNQRGSATSSTALFQILVQHNFGRALDYYITFSEPLAGVDNWSSGGSAGVMSPVISVPSGLPTWLSFTCAIDTLAHQGSWGIEVSVQGQTPTRCLNNNFDFTDHAMMVGAFTASSSTVSPPPETPYLIDLFQCCRYLPRWFWKTASAATHPGYSTSTTNGIVSLPYDVEPRVQPSGLLTSAANTFSLVDVTAGTQTNCTSAPAFSAATPSMLLTQAAATTALTARRELFFGSGSAGGGFSQAYILATGAEL